MAGRRKRKEQTIKRIIALLVVLCIAAACYIVHMVKAGNDAGQTDSNVPEASEPVETPESEEPAEAPEEPEPEPAASSEAASHVYSHRGSAGEDELSFAAYDKAIEAGSEYIEADMVVSASGTVYVAHDDYAKDMTGINGYFSGMTDGQIDAIKTRAGHNVLKLSDLFDKYGDSVTYLIDIKYTSARNITAFKDIVQKYGYENQVIATAFYLDALRPLEETFPDMTKLYLCADQGSFNIALNASYLDILAVPKELITADNVKAAHDAGKKFCAWTLNSEEEIRSAIDVGVDTYYTDDTELAIKLEEQYR